MKTIGQSALEMKRMLNGLTRKQVGEALHVSERTIYDYEHGNTIPTKASTLLALCKLYHLSPGQLRNTLILTQKKAAEQLPFDENTSIDNLEEMCCVPEDSDATLSLDELLAPVNPIEQVAAYFEDYFVSEYDKIDLLVETIRLYLLHQNNLERPAADKDS